MAVKNARSEAGYAKCEARYSTRKASRAFSMRAYRRAVRHEERREIVERLADDPFPTDPDRDE